MRKRTRLLVCVLTLSMAVAVSAQEKRAAEPTPAEWRLKIQADKKGIVDRAMKLTPEQAKKFWPLYDSFQQELEKPRREYSRAVLDYVAAGDSLSDANARRLAEQALAATVDEARLREKHFKKLLGVLPAKTAARYAQVENKIEAVLRYETAAAVPLVQ
jgi:Spy/CpxP family protein refolding chaperone